MKMILNRDYVLVHASGVSVGFKKNVPTYVPPRLVQDAMGLGAEAEQDGDQTLLDTIQAKIDAEKLAASQRDGRITDAIKKMTERNQRGDFTGAGKPNLRILANLSGLDVTPEELDPIWAKIQAELQ